MEGLEISEILQSELERTARIDSEFYAKENLSALKVIERKAPESLTKFLNVSDGTFEYIGGVPDEIVYDQDGC